MRIQARAVQIWILRADVVTVLPDGMCPGAWALGDEVAAGAVMAVVILAFAGLVGYIAMPALAGLLILVGYRTIKPGDLQSVW